MGVRLLRRPFLPRHGDHPRGRPHAAPPSVGVVMATDEIDLVDVLVRISRSAWQSCGQCVPCRVGCVRQNETMVVLQEKGSLTSERRQLVDDIAVMVDASICRHTATNAINSAIKLGLVPGCRRDDDRRSDFGCNRVSDDRRAGRRGSRGHLIHKACESALHRHAPIAGRRTSPRSMSAGCVSSKSRVSGHSFRRVLVPPRRAWSSRPIPSGEAQPQDGA